MWRKGGFPFVTFVMFPTSCQPQTTRWRKSTSIQHPLHPLHNQSNLPPSHTTWDELWRDKRKYPSSTTIMICQKQANITRVGLGMCLRCWFATRMRERAYQKAGVQDTAINFHFQFYLLIYLAQAPLNFNAMRGLSPLIVLNFCHLDMTRRIPCCVNFDTARGIPLSCLKHNTEG